MAALNVTLFFILYMFIESEPLNSIRTQTTWVLHIVTLFFQSYFPTMKKKILFVAAIITYYLAD